MRRCWSGGILDERNQTLVAWAGSIDIPFLILDLCLNVVDGIGGLNLKGNGLSSESLYEDLHGCKWMVVGGRRDERRRMRKAASRLESPICNQLQAEFGIRRWH